jgi:Ca2+-binding EF-hand superfamily protein
MKEGVKKMEQQAAARQDRERAKLVEAHAREKAEEADRNLKAEYEKVRDAISANPTVRIILDENKILTGDDIRPGDTGYDLEVPPHGTHCFLLAKLLFLLGCNIKDAVILERLQEEDLNWNKEECWWTEDLADAWMILQGIADMEIIDGVVEKECLQKMLCDPDDFLHMRHMAEDEIERKERNAIRRSSSVGSMNSDRPYRSQGAEVKPSMEELSHELGVSVARLNWLHALFEGFLATEDDEGPAPTCGYPENPASLSKEQMRGLMMELKPDLTNPEFEAHFRRVDEDGSGLVEFDEFVTWLCENEINITGVKGSRKMTFVELAGFYDVAEERILYLYSSFVNSLADYDENLEDDYPHAPVKLPKDDVRALCGFVQPNMALHEFERNFDIADVSKEEALDFAEFLEMIEFDDVPDDGSP